MKLSIIKQTLEKVKELPTLPVVANKVNVLLSDPKSSASELANVIELDQSITAKILRLVNSAYYSLPQRVTNIQQAIGLLGFKNISYIVLTLSVFDTLRKSTRSSFNRRKFWVHAIATAILSVKIAKLCGYKFDDDVFTAGLLHDIGKVFMDGFLHESFQAIIDYTSKHNTSFHQAEQDLYDVDHTLVGEWIARSWKFPIHVIAVIKHHHQDPPERKGLILSSDISVDFVRLADIFIRKAGFGINGDGPNFKPELFSDLFKRLPLYEEDLVQQVGNLKEDIKNSETLLNLAAEV